MGESGCFSPLPLAGEGKSPLRRWSRLSAQWLTVGLAHAAALAGVLQASPPPPLTLPTVIQASLVAHPSPTGLAEPSPAEVRPEPPPKTPPPKKPKPPKKARAPQKPPERIPDKPEPLRVAAPAKEEAPAASFEVAQTPEEPPQSVPAATTTGAGSGAGLPSAATSAANSAGNSATGTLTPPIFNAGYLKNPHPPYPPLSLRRGETGQVLLRVHVSVKGRADRVEINQSSGFDRLDDAARDAVYGWRFVPARRGEERVAAWVLIPVSFVL